MFNKTLGITADESAKIEKEVTLELYQAQCKLVELAGVTNILMGIFVIFVFYSQIKLSFLLSWYAVLFLINGLNMAVAFYRLLHAPKIEELKSKIRIYYFLLGLVAFIWSFVGIFFVFFPINVDYQLFAIAFLLTALVAFSIGTAIDFTASIISVTSLLALPTIFYAYSATQAIWTKTQGMNLGVAFVITLINIGIFSIITCYLAHRLIKKSFELTFTNVELSKKLEDANKFLEHRVQERTVELERSFELVRYQATHDLLTHLPNERLLEEYIEAEINQVEQSNQMFAVFFVGLNEMDKINDGLGHQASAMTVQIVAKRLKNFFNENKKGSFKNIKFSLSLSRRDEFVILLNPLSEPEMIENMALSFFSVLEEPVQLNNHALKLTASIGVSVYPRDGQNIKSLLMNADAAMRVAKKWGGNRIDIYKTEINADLSKQLERESYLHDALKNDEFRLFYQPFIDLKTGRICGMEALLRWKNPKLGFVSPADFIPLAEANGIILPLGEWVLRTACAQTKFWHLEGFSSLKVAINLSAKQLQQKDIIKIVTNILKETHLDPEYVELELTETEAFKEEAIPVIKQFKAMKLNLSIDDFGTGYSGLTNLKLFAIDKLKIDKSFVQDIEDSEDSRNIVINTIQLAKKMGIAVLAEGVETKEQLNFLRENGCDMIQGYYFSPAVTVDAFSELLVSKQSLSF